MSFTTVTVTVATTVLLQTHVPHPLSISLVLPCSDPVVSHSRVAFIVISTTLSGTVQSEMRPWCYT